MISQTVEYALRAVVTIAQHEGEPRTAKQISQTTQVPLAYLSKLMQGLVRGGLVHSQRGRHGGFTLTKSADEMTIWEIVDLVDPVQRIRQCPLGLQSHGVKLCPLHRRLDSAMESIEAMFRATTVAEVLSQPGSVTPLCEPKKTFTLEVGGRSRTTRSKTTSK